MAASAVTILHGLQGSSPVVTDTGCCPSAAQSQLLPGPSRHNLNRRPIAGSRQVVLAPGGGRAEPDNELTRVRSCWSKVLPSSWLSAASLWYSSGEPAAACSMREPAMRRSATSGCCSKSPGGCTPRPLGCGCGRRPQHGAALLFWFEKSPLRRLVAGQRRVVISRLGDEHRIRRQHREPVVHPFGVGGVLPVRKEPCGVGEGQPAFDLVDLEREGDSLRGACLDRC